MTPPSSSPVLDRRTLNRTLLARQLLLERVSIPVAAVLERLVGMQAQEPPDPYVGLWSRIDKFDPEELSRSILERGAVRLGLMRTTLHLVTARDALALYPVMRSVLVRTYRNTPFAKALAGVDAEPILARAREILEERPRTPTELGRALAADWPDADPASMAYLARFHLPLVQVPPRGLWGQTARPSNTTVEAWLGGPVDAATTADAAVRRYLVAFGPASVADIRIWSWLTGLRAVVDRLRPGLRTYRDERGRELFDVEEGVIVDADTPAEPRFLGQYDNIFLSHDDRSRIVGDHVAGHEMGWKGSVLIDGFGAGAWRVRHARRVATMTLEVFGPIATTDRVAVEEEAARLLDFVAADAERRDLQVILDPA